MNQFSSILSPKILVVVALLFSAEIAAFPDTFSAKYTLSGKGMALGETLYNLTKSPTDNSNLFTIHTEPTGLAKLFVKKIIDEKSVWEWRDNNISPLQYNYHRSGKKQKSKSRTFNWASKSVTIKEDGNEQKLDQLHSGTVDEALFLLALMHDLQNGSRDLKYQVAKPTGWSNYIFTIGESDAIQVPAGTFKSVHIIRQKEGKRTFELWVAPELDYLPVQVEYREKDGTLFRLQLKESNIR